jgi:2-polyprenyl-3-methyl-5-hydroxy-6-metoxy-1,4-benzoquinol methylase
LRKRQKEITRHTKDFLITGESFELVYDEELEMLTTYPQPKVLDLPKYYESEAYISHTDAKTGLMAILYQWIKKYSLALKLRLIRSMKDERGSLLDIGAGTGEFLKLAGDNGWNIQGIEPNEKARKLANSKGVELKDAMKSLEGVQYDVVTLWHVLEHLPELEVVVKEIEAFVKPGGLLIIAVPNFNSFDARYYKNYWAAYDVPRHLWHFSKRTMEKLFSTEMDLIKIKPMIFDSYYVSLLSEKYKTGKSFSIKAIFIGLWSNISAMSTREYSSQIYCYKKSDKAI